MVVNTKRKYGGYRKTRKMRGGSEGAAAATTGASKRKHDRSAALRDRSSSLPGTGHGFQGGPPRTKRIKTQPSFVATAEPARRSQRI